MKKIIFISIIYLFANHFCFSQSNHQFPDSAASWSGTQIVYGGPGDPWIYSVGRLKVDGDTLIFGINYRKLYWLEYCDSMAQGIVGYYRVDSMKVYYRDEASIAIPPFVNIPYVNYMFSDTGEVILYDFGLVVGDTFQFQAGMIDSVSVIDSVLLNGSYYKRTVFQNMYTNGNMDPYYWIEGVGSTYGFFPAYYIFENALFFNCFTTTTDTLIFSGSCPCSPVGIIDNETKDYEMKVAPNPFVNSSRISFPTNNKHTLRIFNLLGNEVKYITFTGKEFEIEMGELQKGMYFIKSENETISSKKIIIQ